MPRYLAPTVNAQGLPAGAELSRNSYCAPQTGFEEIGGITAFIPMNTPIVRGEIPRKADLTIILYDYKIKVEYQPTT